MELSAATVHVLAEVAASKVQDFTDPERIKIYTALGETLPTQQERDLARRTAKALSQAAALQMEFQEMFKGEEKQ